MIEVGCAGVLGILGKPFFNSAASDGFQRVENNLVAEAERLPFGDSPSGHLRPFFREQMGWRRFRP